MDWVLINNLIYMNKTSNRLSEWDSQKNAALEVCFNCMTCGRVYRSKTALSLHVRVECGKEPQRQCVFCLRKFYHNGDLNRHLRHVHKVNVSLSGRDNNKNVTVNFKEKVFVLWTHQVIGVERQYRFKWQHLKTYKPTKYNYWFLKNLEMTNSQYQIYCTNNISYFKHCKCIEFFQFVSALISLFCSGKPT